MFITALFLFLSIFFPQLHHTACRLLVLLPGIESVPTAVETLSLNHWTPRRYQSTISNSNMGVMKG